MNYLFPIQPFHKTDLPASGKHIVAHTTANHIVVYQAFKAETAEYAVANQRFGYGFSFNRMSWIKPNFLWMMYRSGWASKEGQENILAIWLTKSFFEEILLESVFSSFDESRHSSVDAWKAELYSHEVRLQWDPDHDPYGKALDRRAIQLGLKGKILKRYGTEEVAHIRNITPFVHEQFEHVRTGRLDQLIVPVEHVYKPKDILIATKLGID
jgi:hypothetical protein